METERIGIVVSLEERFEREKRKKITITIPIWHNISDEFARFFNLVGSIFVMNIDKNLPLTINKRLEPN